MNFYKRHLGDYAKDAGHLSMLEHGAYTLLLDRYYTTEEPIPSRADAYRVCRARTKDERAAVDTILEEFFLTDSEAFLNRRAEEEIARASHQRSVNQELGKRGGRPRKTESVIESKTESVSVGEPNRNPSQTPDSRLHKPEIPKPKSSAIALPDWLPIEAWAGFVEMRKRVKAPLTDRAVLLSLGELEKLRAQGQDVTAVLEQSTMNAWKGLFPIKRQQSGQPSVLHGPWPAGSVAARTKGQDADGTCRF